MKCNLVNNGIHENFGENLIRERGVKDFDLFMNPTDDCLQRPDDLDNILEGSKKYLNILEKEEPKIMLIVDSDIDGFTSSAIFYKYTKDISPNVKIDWLLHSGKQHGLQDHIDYLIDCNIDYDLIVCPDSSSNDYEYHERLKELGIPVLVLDHHIVEKDCPLSDNAYIINNQLSENYKNKQLTGAGIVYQFCRYVDEILSCSYSNQYIDLAALGIIGDMGSVLELENRYIIKNGLENIRNEFFWELMRKQGYSITGKMNPSDNEILEKMSPITTAFYIVPLVNAMIRVGSESEKARAFLAFIDGTQEVPSNKRGAKGTYEKVSVESARECSNARNRQNKTLETAINSVEDKIIKYNLLDNRILFVRLEDTDSFPPELNGLMATKLSAKYKRPTIVTRLNDEGFDRGSMRGLNQSELTSFKEFLDKSGLFEYVQGHDNAAGCSILDKDIDKFHEWANEELKEIDFGENVYDVDFYEFGDSKILDSIIFDLSKYSSVWGQGNSQPLICVHNIKLTSKNVQICGSRADTVRFNYNGICYLQFHAKDLIEDLAKYDKMNVTVVGRANINEWGGNITPQIFIEDYEIQEDILTTF